MKTKKSRKVSFEWLVLAETDIHLNSELARYFECTADYETEIFEQICHDGKTRRFWRLTGKEMADNLWNNRDAIGIKNLRIYVVQIYNGGTRGPARDLTDILFSRKFDTKKGRKTLKPK